MQSYQIPHIRQAQSSKKLVFQLKILQSNISDVFPSKRFLKNRSKYLHQKTKRRILNYFVSLSRYRYIYVSQGKLAEIAGCTWQTAHAIVNELVRDGLINRITRGYMQTCCYRISSYFLRQDVRNSLRNVLECLKSFALNIILSLKNIEIEKLILCEYHIQLNNGIYNWEKEKLNEERIMPDNPYMNSPTKSQKPGSNKPKEQPKRESQFEILQALYPFPVYKGFTSDYQLEILAEATQQKRRQDETISSSIEVSKPTAIQQLRQNDMLPLETEIPFLGDDSMWEEI